LTPSAVTLTPIGTTAGGWILGIGILLFFVLMVIGAIFRQRDEVQRTRDIRAIRERLEDDERRKP
jgi:hypothetical protein